MRHCRTAKPGSTSPMSTFEDTQARYPQLRLHRYVLVDGFEAWAGRTDLDNDLLSIKVARPDDWWFHVRGMPGSHVLLRAPEDAPPGPELLKTAAAIAAWHSKARGGGTVAVAGTLARHVRKPRGVKAGTVQIRRERIFKVRPRLPEG
jgi:predicted ribosome quality control (RQC) complex YloA/Tae2 family protein